MQVIVGVIIVKLTSPAGVTINMNIVAYLIAFIIAVIIGQAITFILLNLYSILLVWLLMKWIMIFAL